MRAVNSLASCYRAGLAMLFRKYPFHLSRRLVSERKEKKKSLRNQKKLRVALMKLKFFSLLDEIKFDLPD